MASQDEPCEVGEQVEVSWTPITMFPIEDKSENKETTFIAEVIEVRNEGEDKGLITAIKIIEMMTKMATTDNNNKYNSNSNNCNNSNNSWQMTDRWCHRGVIFLRQRVLN